MKYSNKTVLADISLKIKNGEVISIIGPSGAGKSTLLRIFNLLNHPFNGTYKIGQQNYDFENISAKDVKSIRSSFAMVFQQYGLFKNKTVLENVSLPLERVKKVSERKANELASEWLQKVGLENKEGAFPEKLSGGQKQRVAIARCLAMEPKILLLDEPTAALDPELVNGVLRIIKELAETRKYTILIVTHEMGFAKAVSDRVIFLDDGKIVDFSEPKNIFEYPRKLRIKNFIEQINQNWDN